MATVTVGPNVTAEQVMGTLREQFPSAKVEPAKHASDAVLVQGNAFSRAKVHVRQGGGSTTLDVKAAPIGPIGLLVSALWFAPRVSRALGEAAQLRA